jgi:hypothetical protein
MHACSIHVEDFQINVRFILFLQRCLEISFSGDIFIFTKIQKNIFLRYSYFSQFTFLCPENYLNLPKNLLENYLNLPKNLLRICLKLLMRNYYGGVLHSPHPSPPPVATALVDSARGNRNTYLA